MTSAPRFAARIALAMCLSSLAACLTAQARFGAILAHRVKVQPDLAVKCAVATESLQLVDQRTLRFEGRPWLQLEFDELALDGASLLEIRSLADGATEVFDARSRGRRFSSYFNGSAVQLRLWARRPDAVCRYSIRSVGVGDIQKGGASIATLCGVDDRAPSVDRRVGRLLLRFQNGFSWCSSFLISPSGDGRAWDCFATSGQCLALGGVTSMTVEFQVPSSRPDGTIVHPAPVDQYSVSSRRQFVSGPAGTDWGLFATLPNVTTGLHAGVVQRGGFRFSTLTTLPTSVSLLSYGTSTLQPARNGVQQSGTGTAAVAGSVLRHRADTTGGSAGGAILDPAGDLYAIQVEGGCDASATSANAGTMASTPAFVTARKAFCRERIDLEISTFRVDTTNLVAGKTIEFESTTVNAGSLTCPATNSGYYLSDDATITATDRLLHAFQLPILTATKSYLHRVRVRVPNDVTTRACYVGVLADDRGQRTEWNEANNARAIAVQCVARPNLVADNFAIVESTLRAGVIITVDVAIRNDGGLAASGAEAAVVLSDDALVTRQDRLLSAFALPALAPSAEFKVRGPIPIPRDIASGTCWVGLLADAKDALVEAREDDNTKAVQRTCVGLPELVASNVTFDGATMRPNLPFFATARVDNFGTVSTPATTTRFVLSKDNVVSQDDVVLGVVSVPPMSPSSFVTVRLNAVAPAKIDAGSCFLGAFVDPDNGITEQLETNNTATLAITCSSSPVRADLRPSAFTSSTQRPEANQVVQFDATVRNDGFVTAPACRVGFYLSDDDRITTADRLLVSSALQRLARGARTNLKANARMPVSLASGSCWFGVLVDDLSVVLEEDETNNDASIAATCVARADLLVRSLQLSTTRWAAGTDLTITLEVENRGGAAATLTSTGFYMSRDPVLDTSDRLLLAQDLQPLGATQRRTVRVSTRIPNDVKSGECWIGAVLDRNRILREIDENNNVAAQLGRCVELPDLVCTTLDVLDSRLRAGSSIALRTVIQNRGRAAAPPTEVAVVLTPTSASTLESPLLATVKVPQLGAGARYDVTTRHVVPWFVTGPRSVVTAYVDAAGLVPESNESNNISSTSKSSSSTNASRRSLEWVPRYPDVSRSTATLSLAKRKGADLQLTMPKEAGYAYILIWSRNRSLFVFDDTSAFALGLLNGPAFLSWVGILDAQGRGSAGFRLPQLSNIVFDVAVHGLLLKPGLVFDGFASDILTTAIRP